MVQGFYFPSSYPTVYASGESVTNNRLLYLSPHWPTMNIILFWVMIVNLFLSALYQYLFIREGTLLEEMELAESQYMVQNLQMKTSNYDTLAQVCN